MDTVRDKLVELENSKERTLHSIQREPPSLKVEPHPNIGQLYRRRVEQLTKFIFDKNTREEAASIIRSLIDRIEITPSQKRGHPCVELVGGLDFEGNFDRDDDIIARRHHRDRHTRWRWSWL